MREWFALRVGIVADEWSGMYCGSRGRRSLWQRIFACRGTRRFTPLPGRIDRLSTSEERVSFGSGTTRIRHGHEGVGSMYEKRTYQESAVDTVSPEEFTTLISHQRGQIDLDSAIGLP